MPEYNYEIEGDIALHYDAEIGYGDILVSDRDLDRDPGLRTAIVISLFTNRRAEDVDDLPDTEGSREGWWADELRDGDNKIGSKLWLIGRSKTLEQDVLPLAEQYTREALQWMIDDGVAETVNVSVEFTNSETLHISVSVVRPDIAQAEFFNFYYNWLAESSRS